MKRLLRAFMVLFLILISAKFGYAYGDITGVIVSPVSKSLTLSKGQVKNITFTVYNESNEEKVVNIRPRNWFVVDENRSIPLESWLDVLEPKFTLAPREKKKVTLRVSAPKEAAGELAAMIAFIPEPKADQAVNVVFSVSLYLTIRGTERIAYQISDFKLKKIDKRDAMDINVAIKNDSNVHLEPDIKVTIQSALRKRYIRKAVFEEGRPTYPGKIQGYRGFIYKLRLKPGLYRALIEVEFKNIVRSLRKGIYFLVGRKGRVIYTFFKKEKE